MLPFSPPVNLPNTMVVSLQTLESKLAQERIEIDHLQGQLEVAREKAERDKDALKKAARLVQGKSYTHVSSWN